MTDSSDTPGSIPDSLSGSVRNVLSVHIGPDSAPFRCSLSASLICDINSSIVLDRADS